MRKPRKNKDKREFVILEPSQKFDPAIVKTGKDNFTTYSFERLIQIEIKCGIGSREDAIEWINWNVLGTWEYENGCFAIDYKRK
jgi:hypothetical protein